MFHNPLGHCYHLQSLKGVVWGSYWVEGKRPAGKQVECLWAYPGNGTHHLSTRPTDRNPGHTRLQGDWAMQSAPAPRTHWCCVHMIFAKKASGENAHDQEVEVTASQDDGYLWAGESFNWEGNVEVLKMQLQGCPLHINSLNCSLSFCIFCFSQQRVFK